ncbi:uncharacterized protein LOC133645917 [Entelurus aequoreus]|uniref:uncharacterized protein LOC133645917 n=1 Tax=Entelurus aequoreus TaxID=161455 RepID=UPI002B1D345B|nr:uncharacterized protein LOC133645917 [Entelurus aequoreus]
MMREERSEKDPHTSEKEAAARATKNSKNKDSSNLESGLPHYSVSPERTHGIETSTTGAQSTFGSEMSAPNPLEALGRVLAEVSAASHQQMEAVRHQMAQQSQILLALAGGVGAAPPTSAAVSGQRMAETEDIFEATAAACGWPEEEWGVRLLPLLAGKTQQAVLSLPAASRVHFPDLRRAILDRVSSTAEDHRRRFRALRLGPEDCPFVLGQQLRDAATRGGAGVLISPLLLLSSDVRTLLRRGFPHRRPLEHLGRCGGSAR